MDRARTAIVVGGGIAGPVTAIALRKAGIEATVYEAYEGTAEGIGGALTLAPNGIAALDAPALVFAKSLRSPVSIGVSDTIAYAFGRARRGGRTIAQRRFRCKEGFVHRILRFRVHLPTRCGFPGPHRLRSIHSWDNR